jgi:hypothetical protein
MTGSQQPPLQSSPELQPHCPATHRVPEALFAQSTQVSPFSPQAVLEFPETHTVPELGSQQPDGHVATHVFEAWLQHPLPHSVPWVHPHAPLTHTNPTELCAQSEQGPPLLPHWVGVPPPTQIPALQQPPTHGFDALQPTTHVPAVEQLVALDGQSLTLLHPQVGAPPSAIQT